MVGDGITITITTKTNAILHPPTTKTHHVNSAPEITNGDAKIAPHGKKHVRSANNQTISKAAYYADKRW